MKMTHRGTVVTFWSQGLQSPLGKSGLVPGIQGPQPSSEQGRSPPAAQEPWDIGGP